MSTDDFLFDDAMKRALDDHRVPPMSADFADRVVAATKGRAAPLPRTRPATPYRWRTGRRLVIAVVAAGALATAAAATGILRDLGIDLPSPQQVWTRVTGQEPVRAPDPAPATRIAPAPEPRSRVTIEGAIDTPDELEEAFRRVDEVRSDRREGRRERVDSRIDGAIERRRAQGLPLSPEQEERLRNRVDTFRDRADEQLEQRDALRREELREQLEREGEVTRHDIIDSAIPDGPVAQRLQQLRDLPPEERREVLRQWRERRQERLRRLQEDAPPPEEPAPPPPRTTGSLKKESGRSEGFSRIARHCDVSPGRNGGPARPGTR